MATESAPDVTNYTVPAALGIEPEQKGTDGLLRRDDALAHLTSYRCELLFVLSHRWFQTKT